MPSPFDDIFGSATTAPAPGATPQHWRQTLRLDDLERQHDLPAGLMTAVLRQESGGDPRVKSSAGAQGLFQFMPATAAQYKIDANDPEQAAPAAAKELRTLYTKYHGDVDRTLAAWNWGQGNVDRKGMERMPTETRGFLAHVKRFIGPTSAEAATPQGGRDLTGTFAQPQPGGGRDLTDMLFGATPQQAAPSAVWEDIFGGQQPAQATQPSPPTATAPPSQDAAYRQWAAQQAPGVSQTPPAEEPITPDARFLRLPSVMQMPWQIRAQRFHEFYRLRPDLKEEFLRSEEPPSDLTVDIEKPSTPQGDPRPGVSPAPGQPGWAAGMIDPLQPRGAQAAQAEVQRPAPLPVPPEAAIAALPGMAGYAIGAKLAPLLGPIGKVVPPLLEAAGGYLGRRANVALGNEEEGLGGDVLSLLPLVTRGLGSATAGWFERTMKEVPAPARNQTLDLLGKLFSRGGAPATLTYALSGDPQLAAWVGGSTAVARQLLEFGLRHPAGKQLVEQTLKAGRAIGGEELGMLMNIGRTGHTATPHSTRAREGTRPVDLVPLMDHPHWKTLTTAQRKEALSIWQEKDTSDADRAAIRQLMDGWQAEAATAR